jgi:hypothetical protein
LVAHKRLLFTAEKTCIDCHKDIAHHPRHAQRPRLAIKADAQGRLSAARDSGIPRLKLDQDQCDLIATSSYVGNVRVPSSVRSVASHFHCARRLRPPGRSDRQGWRSSLGVSLSEAAVAMVQCLGTRTSADLSNALARLASVPRST